jgi:hypothetical protein
VVFGSTTLGDGGGEVSVATTLAVLRALLERAFNEEYPLPSGTITSMTSKTVLADSSRAESDKAWVDGYIYLEGESAPGKEERRIIDFAKSGGVFTVTPGFSSTAGSGLTYEIHMRAKRQDYIDAINQAIENARGWWMEEKPDESLIIVESQLEYDLPAECEVILELNLERVDVVETGTATGGSTTTLEDSSKNWETDEFASGYTLVIYDGTGEGQSVDITSNTSNTLTFGTLSTAPDSTSRYKIKDVAKEEQPWAAITEFSWNRNVGATPKLHLYHYYDAGMALQVRYLRHPQQLAEGESTTVDEQYVRYQGLSYLCDVIASRVSGSDSERLLREADRWHLKAQEYRRDHPYRPPMARMRRRGKRGYTRPRDWPF